MTIFIADAGPDVVVIYADDGTGRPPYEHARYPRGASAKVYPGYGDQDAVLADNGWYRLRAWRAPHDAPNHLVAQVVPWSTPGNPGRPE